MKCQGTDQLRPKVSYKKCFVFTWVGIELNVLISVNPQHFIPFSRIHLDLLPLLSKHTSSLTLTSSYPCLHHVLFAHQPQTTHWLQLPTIPPLLLSLITILPYQIPESTDFCHLHITFQSMCPSLPSPPLPGSICPSTSLSPAYNPELRSISLVTLGVSLIRRYF